MVPGCVKLKATKAKRNEIHIPSTLDGTNCDRMRHSKIENRLHIH